MHAQVVYKMHRNEAFAIPEERYINAFLGYGPEDPDFTIGPAYNQPSHIYE